MLWIESSVELTNLLPVATWCSVHPSSAARTGILSRSSIHAWTCLLAAKTLTSSSSCWLVVVNPDNNQWFERTKNCYFLPRWIAQTKYTLLLSHWGQNMPPFACLLMVQIETKAFDTRNTSKHTISHVLHPKGLLHTNLNHAIGQLEAWEYVRLRLCYCLEGRIWTQCLVSVSVRTYFSLSLTFY